LSVIRWTRSPEFVTTACELFFDASLSVDQVVSVGDYWLAGQGRDSGFPHPRDVEVVREATRDYRATSSEVRLFVPRSGFGRAPEGEERLASRLVNEHGFQVFDSTKKKWLEQIDLFSRAELVVGVHGGALSNLVFCQRNVRVIEILPLSRVVTCFANLARVLELDYRSLLLVPEHNNAYGDISTMEDEIIRLL
jgi:capsular polysaccharide biosynthesis protein